MAEHADRAPRRIPSLAPPPRVLIVAAPYYQAITQKLIDGAQAVLEQAAATVERADAPGALEIATAIRLAADTRRYDGFIALGCVIRGETTHYEIVTTESARGLTMLGVERGLPIGNGVLTVENEGQALDRADPARQDKGGDAAIACLQLIAMARQFGGGGSRPSDDQILLA